MNFCKKGITIFLCTILALCISAPITVFADSHQKNNVVVSQSIRINAPKINTKAVNAHVKISWKKCSGATKYYVYRAKGISGSFKKIGETKKHIIMIKL